MSVLTIPKGGVAVLRIGVGGMVGGCGENPEKSLKILKNGGKFQTFLVLRVGAFCENGKMGAETPF
ncbi:hypothetical protein ACFOX2_12625, partial [Corynebacterium marambiense]|uniref:hypothetical protein n=1 Tax=Actinomycetes TaxID=1760 RepID=UPI001E5CEBDA